MSILKEKRIKKLTKHNMWPPILFFVFSLLIAGIMVVACAGTFFTYLVQSRFEQACIDATQISSIISSRLEQGEDIPHIVSFIEETTYLTDAVLIIDDQDNIVKSFGDNTVFWDSHQLFRAKSNYLIYMDEQEKQEILAPNGDVNITMGILLHKLFSETVTNADTGDWYHTELIKIAYWTGTAIGDTSYTVLVKSYIDIYAMDAIFVIGLGAILLVMTFIPLLFLFINIIGNIRTQRRMTTIICTDTSTGGKNWFYFDNSTAKMLEKKKNAGKHFDLIDFSLMKFRSYCSCYGVENGDNLLEQIDQYLNAHIKKGEYCAHFGKSQFVVLLKCEEEQSSDNRIQQWIVELPEFLNYPQAVFHAGIYHIEPLKNEKSGRIIYRKNVDVAQLCNYAGAARASIEEKENSAIEHFNTKMLEEQIWNNKVVINMQKALDNEEFQVYLQPKYNPVTESLSGAEALVRWINPIDGLISPGRFIPIFEKNGFITKLDDYMISHTAALQSKWLAEGKAVVPVSVNVSRAHFSQPDLAEHIAALVDAYQVPHELIEIELTESAFFDDKTALLTIVNDLKENGFRVSMDDFGAGYSSLNSLKDLPLDVLKLDADFFRGKFEKERGEIVVSEAIQLAKKLNMRIVAEGVEKKEQVDFLASAGCDMIQGFYYAKPMPADEYVTRMENQS